MLRLSEARSRSAGLRPAATSVLRQPEMFSENQDVIGASVFDSGGASLFSVEWTFTLTASGSRSDA